MRLMILLLNIWAYLLEQCNDIKVLALAKLIRLEYIANRRRLIYPIIGASNIEKRAKRSKMANYDRFTAPSVVEVAKQEAIMKIVRGY